MPLGRPTKQETPWNESIYVRWQRACNAFRRLRLFFCIDMPELETLALFLLEFGESEGGFYESAAVDHSILLEAPRQTSLRKMIKSKSTTTRVTVANICQAHRDPPRPRPERWPRVKI